MDADVVRRYTTLRQRERERKAEAGALKEEADALEQEILEQFAAEGIDSVRIDGKTVYLHRTLWARTEKDVDREAVCGALQEIGLGHFVSETYNANTLSAWMRDLDREGEELPTELKGLVKGEEVYQVRVRTS